MKHRVYHALLELLTKAPTAPVPELLPDLLPESDEDRAAVWTLAQEEKCHLNLALYWRARGGAEFSQQSDLEVAPQRQAHSLDIVRRLPPSAILLKGQALHRHYPEGIDRFSADIDVLIEDPTALRDVHASVQPAGYVQDGAGYWHVPRRSDMKGLFASLRYWTPERTKATTSMEVQIGGFPISWTKLLPFEVLARGARPLPGFGCRCLSPTGQLLLAITDYGSRRSPITVRHLADLLHLLEAEGDQVDLAALAQDLTLHRLWHGLDKLFVAMEARGLRTRVPPLLEALSRLRPARALGDPSRRRPLATGLDRLFTSLERRRFGRKLERWACQAPLVDYMLRADFRVCGLPIVTRPQPVTQLVECEGVYFLVHGAGVCALTLMRGTDAHRRALFDLFRSTTTRRVVAQFGSSP